MHMGKNTVTNVTHFWELLLVIQQPLVQSHSSYYTNLSFYLGYISPIKTFFLRCILSEIWLVKVVTNVTIFWKWFLSSVYIFIKISYSIRTNAYLMVLIQSWRSKDEFKTLTLKKNIFVNYLKQQKVRSLTWRQKVTNMTMLIFRARKNPENSSKWFSFRLIIQI